MEPQSSDAKPVDSVGDATEVAQPPKPNVRRDFYQTESDFVLNIMAKNVDASTVNVTFQPEQLTVTAKLPDGQDYTLDEKLFAKIRPDDCGYKVTKTKIEVQMRKDTVLQWPALEAVKLKEVAPSYPSSSKNKKDWGKVEKKIEEEIKDDENDINSLFAKIYSSGDENTKRAMMKSMQESGGTVLSTNWSEVGAKKIDISPPDGMEWKKWDEK